MKVRDLKKVLEEVDDDDTVIVVVDELEEEINQLSIYSAYHYGDQVVIMV